MDSEIVSKKAFPDRSLETQSLVDRFLQLEDDELVTYQELSAIIRKDVQHEGMHHRSTAMRIARNEHLVCLACVNGEGVKRLTPEATAETGKMTIGKVRRESKRGLQRLACVKFDKLSTEKKLQHNISASILGVLRMMGGSGARKKLANSTTDTAQLPVQRTLEQFTKKD